jgi:hypothetical protein
MTWTWPVSPKEADIQFFDLSHPWGHGVPAWPYFEDVKIERLHGMAKSRVLTQKITTVMHSGTHIDAPGHVIENTPLLHEIPLHNFFGTGVVLDIPKGKWEVVTAEDLDTLDAKTRDTLKQECDQLGVPMPLTNKRDYVTAQDAMRLVALPDGTKDEAAKAMSEVKEFYTGVVSRIFKDAIRLADHKQIMTISIDPCTEFYDYLFYSHFGRKTQNVVNGCR